MVQIPYWGIEGTYLENSVEKIYKCLEKKYSVYKSHITWKLPLALSFSIN